MDVDSFSRAVAGENRLKSVGSADFRARPVDTVDTRYVEKSSFPDFALFEDLDDEKEPFLRSALKSYIASRSGLYRPPGIVSSGNRR
ncbi:hypothetical protein [Sphingomonas sp. dw_22]|uniref:hypothetical protein n=1 Tax=Sphingomonas sp. dw_22 TaxID=2721175 RepID=UPI001BD5DC1A|nr:hypothetical protein [Sphingomonas sp. dw_22]